MGTSALFFCPGCAFFVLGEEKEAGHEYEGAEKARQERHTQK
jgi:hypothetical protein